MNTGSVSSLPDASTTRPTAAANAPESITPAASGSLAIHADFSHATGDIDMRLYQGTTNLISSSSVNDDEDIVYAVTGGVTYKIYVYGFLGAANTYTLTTTLTP